MAGQRRVVKPSHPKGGLMDSVLLIVAGHRRSPATMPGYHRGRPPRNKGEHYPADPPTVEEIVAVMRAVGDRPDGQRLRALVVLLWRARGSESAKPWRFKRPTSTACVARSSSAAGKAESDVRWASTAGRGANSNRGWRL